MRNAIDVKLSELGIVLPHVAKPVANYVGWTRSGSLVFTAGQLPFHDGVVAHAGRLGDDVTTQDGQNAARIACINAIAQISAACEGDLSRVKRVLKMNGYVNCTSDYAEIPLVVNGASDLLVSVFGEAGRHARTSIGVAALPLNASVEIYVVVEIS